MSKKRIKRFGILQTSIMAGIIYFAVSFVIFIPFWLISSIIPDTNMFGGDDVFSTIFMFAPFLYGILGFIMTAIMCAVYNLVAKFIGGIEVEVVSEKVVEIAE